MSQLSVYINASTQLSSYDLNSQNSQSNKYQSGVVKNSHNYRLIKTLTSNKNSRIFTILFKLIDQLITNANLNKNDLSNSHLFLGSTSLDIGEIQSVHDQKIWLNELDYINKKLIGKYHFPNLNFTFNTACTSSANALIYATRLIQSGKIKQALVIGAEFYNPLTLKGFDSLELLSRDELLAFSKQRDGMILGEGVGALLLSSQQKQERCFQVLAGYSSCDTYSLTTTQECGEHITKVINKALELGQLTADKIDLIKVHGTASPASDNAEAAALKNLFSENAKSSNYQPPIFALKPFIGHTLGACGVLEIAILNELLQRNQIPVPDYANDASQCLMPFISAEKQQNKFSQVNYILANHCGFGGNNAAILLKKSLHSNELNNKVQSTKVIEAQTLKQISESKTAYLRDTPKKLIKKAIKLKTGFEVRRMDIFTLIALETVFDLLQDSTLRGVTGLYSIANYFSVELLQSLIESVEQQQDIRPFDFISTVGNAANFHVAKQFALTGPNLFLGKSDHSSENAKLLAQSDLNLKLIHQALIIEWQESEESLICKARLLTTIDHAD